MHGKPLHVHGVLHAAITIHVPLNRHRDGVLLHVIAVVVVSASLTRHIGKAVLFDQLVYGFLALMIKTIRPAGVVNGERPCTYRITVGADDILKVIEHPEGVSAELAHAAVTGVQRAVGVRAQVNLRHHVGIVVQPGLDRRIVSHFRVWRQKAIPRPRTRRHARRHALRQGASREDGALVVNTGVVAFALAIFAPETTKARREEIPHITQQRQDVLKLVKRGTLALVEVSALRDVIRLAHGLLAHQRLDGHIGLRKYALWASHRGLTGSVLRLKSFVAIAYAVAVRGFHRRVLDRRRWRFR